jgi:hypothetical protein
MGGYLEVHRTRLKYRYLHESYVSQPTLSVPTTHRSPYLLRDDYFSYNLNKASNQMSISTPQNYKLATEIMKAIKIRSTVKGHFRPEGNWVTLP